MIPLEQVIYLADDGEWRFWESELPRPPTMVVPQTSVPSFWDPEVTVELNEWLPLPQKQFQYHRLIIPVEQWFPKLEEPAQQIAGLKMLIAVAERLLTELEPAPDPTPEVRTFDQWPEWLTGTPGLARLPVGGGGVANFELYPPDDCP